jgi:hypothetical protein
MRTTLAASVALVTALAALPSGQSPAQPSRTPDGHPDLQGTYDIASMTPLERAQGTPLVMTKEEAARFEKEHADRVRRLALPSNGDRSAPPVGGDGSTGAAGNVGGYNNFWVDNGTEYYTIDGQKRMSVIVDPPDGRVPPFDAGSPAAGGQPHRTPDVGCAGERPRLRGADCVRRHGAPAARRTVPPGIRIDFRAAGAAGAL